MTARYLLRDIVTWDPAYGERELTGELVSVSPPVNPSDVFIAYPGEDIRKAKEAGQLLHRKGLSVYLDRADPNVTGDHEGLEEYLRYYIRAIPHLLTIATIHTALSWWVPFEVGVGRETGSQLATRLYRSTIQPVQLPSYLTKWPVLTSSRRLGAWAEAIRLGRPDRIDEVRAHALDDLDILLREGGVELIETP